MKKDFSEIIYTKNIYEKRNTFNTWLRKVNQKELLMRILAKQIKNSSLSSNKRNKKEILDVGCAAGLTSIKLMNLLKKNNIKYNYTAIDPYQAALNKFRNTMKKKRIKNVRLIKGTIQEFKFERKYDFVFISHSLYFVDNIPKLLKKIIPKSKEICIVHNGEEGINSIHKSFPNLVKRGKGRMNIISNYKKITSYLDNLKKSGMEFSYSVIPFSSKIDVSDCSDENSEDGRNLIGFFLARKYETIPIRARKKIHQFFKTKIGKRLTHEEAIILIRNY